MTRQFTSSPRCFLTLASGRSIDLLNPTASDYADFDVLAEQLAKENRFNGATPGVAYSVAEHKWRGALAAFAETSSRPLAAAFLLHDGPEGVLKDDPTPKRRAMVAITDQMFGPSKGAMIDHALDELTDRHDRALHAAAGLAWPLRPSVKLQVTEWDRRMFVTEWRDLMAGAPLPNAESWRDVAPLESAIKPLDNWRAAKALLLEVWREFLPALGGVA
jgi:hypothetical protein